jgi:hypothetical protein
MHVLFLEDVRKLHQNLVVVLNALAIIHVLSIVVVMEPVEKVL